MRFPHLVILLLVCSVISAVLSTQAYMRAPLVRASPPNSPPVAHDDSYTKHRGGTIGPLLLNDSDPDGDPMTVQIQTYPTHGNLYGMDGNSFNYQRTSSTLHDNLRGYLFELSIDSIDGTGDRMEIHIRVEANRLHLEDPDRPGVEIE